MPHFEFTQAVLVQCNIVNNDYQQDSRALYKFVANKPFDSLLEISPKNHISLRTFNSESWDFEVWHIDQNIQPLEIEDRLSLTPVVK